MFLGAGIIWFVRIQDLVKGCQQVSRLSNEKEYLTIIWQAAFQHRQGDHLSMQMVVSITGQCIFVSYKIVYLQQSFRFNSIFSSVGGGAPVIFCSHLVASQVAGQPEITGSPGGPWPPGVLVNSGWSLTPGWPCELWLVRDPRVTLWTLVDPQPCIQVAIKDHPTLLVSTPQHRDCVHQWYKDANLYSVACHHARLQVKVTLGHVEGLKKQNKTLSLTI